MDLTGGGVAVRLPGVGRPRLLGPGVHGGDHVEHDLEPGLDLHLITVGAGSALGRNWR